jgi:3-phosphoshikimate 1-carboxyvinyltransferase
LIRSPLLSDDTETTIRVLRELGITITEGSKLIEVHGGTLKAPKSELFCSESGTTMRFMVALCSLIEGRCTLTGGPSLSMRPVKPLLDALGQIGIDCYSNEGFLPVTVIGSNRRVGGDVYIRGDISSQFISALLLIAPLGKGMKINITTSLESKPYIMMTMDIQKSFGVTVETTDNIQKYLVKNQAYHPLDLTIEGDWSSAANVLAAGALAGNATVDNLNPNSCQADTEILDILKCMGVKIQIGNRRINVEKSDINSIDVDLSNSPDLFPITASLCAASTGVSVIRGLRRLRFKESDRVAAMVEGLQKMGINLRQNDDSLEIEGGKTVGCMINSYNDHRIAMAFSVLGLVSDGVTTILDAESVSKSYPTFWEDFERIGAKIRMNEHG